MFCLTVKAEQRPGNVIKAAVAQEFENGLHAKYLKYFAEKLGMKLELSTMPFARRIRQIRTGELDLIVGIQKTEDRQDEFVYINPYYETLSYRIFTLRKNKDQIKSYDDLFGKLVGINRYAKYFKPFDNEKLIVKFKASGVIQNIELLLRERIDAFIHYEESTIPLIEKLTEPSNIVKTMYQPSLETQHYIAISKHSVLMEKRQELEQIVKNAIKNKELLNIRLAHYQTVHQNRH